MFSLSHIRHLNPLKIHPERIIKADKTMANDLDYAGIKFSVSKKDHSRRIFALIYLVMKMI